MNQDPSRKKDSPIGVEVSDPRILSEESFQPDVVVRRLILQVPEEHREAYQERVVAAEVLRRIAELEPEDSVVREMHHQAVDDKREFEADPEAFKVDPEAFDSLEHR